jgi:lysozyme
MPRFDDPQMPARIEPIAAPQGGLSAGQKAGAGLTLVAIVGVAVAQALGQFIPQEESGRKVEATVRSDGHLAIRHISGRQYLKAYLDMVGVATACDGLTHYRGKPITLTMRFTEAQCTVMLEEELTATAQAVMACTPGLALSGVVGIERRREGPRFAAVSLGYNIGTSAKGYCGSTARKRFNAGDYPGGCAALTWWNKAGGKVSNGLKARRAREEDVCLHGLAVLRK